MINFLYSCVDIVQFFLKIECVYFVVMVGLRLCPFFAFFMRLLLIFYESIVGIPRSSSVVLIFIKVPSFNILLHQLHRNIIIVLVFIIIIFVDIIMYI